MAEIGARDGDEFKAIGTAPSINKTPVGSAMVPVAYPVLHDLSNSVDLSKTTKFNGKAAYLFDKSKQTSTTGDEAGVGKGVWAMTLRLSSAVMASVQWRAVHYWSRDCGVRTPSNGR